MIHSHSEHLYSLANWMLSELGEIEAKSKMKTALLCQLHAALFSSFGNQRGW